MADKASTTVYGVQRIDQRGGQTFDIGTLGYGPCGHLEVVTADPAYRTYLAEVADTVNATEELSIKVPPPPDAEPYSVYFRIVDRTAPDLLDVMRTYLERDYGLLLAEEPATPN
jgi:hypothetical protein